MGGCEMYKEEHVLGMGKIDGCDISKFGAQKYIVAR